MKIGLHAKGIALIVVIILILIVAITVLGIATFISHGLILNVVKASMEQAIFAAQAGIYASLYDYLQYPAEAYWTKTATPQNISGNIYYSAGKDANFLLVSAANSERNGRILRRIPLSNLNATDTITINKMKVEWSNFGGTSLRVIQLGGITRWSGSAGSGTTVALTSPFPLNAKEFTSTSDANTWQFSANIPANAIIKVTFIFDPPTGDASSRKAILYGAGKKNEFSIIATGEVQGTTNWKRSLEATYDAGSGLITSWQEIESHI